jgi:glucan phosphoethanolaminetransferase (alkaline phosphatase superfamily)
VAPKIKIKNKLVVKKHKKYLSKSWSVVIFLTVSLIYLHTFLEWIFFITKPSFMSGMTLGSQVNVFFLAAFGLCVLPILTFVVLAYLDHVLKPKDTGNFLLSIGTLITSLVFSSIVLILVDNFTYTVFSFGIVSTERISRAVYGLLFVVFFIVTYKKIRLFIQVRSKKKNSIEHNQAILIFGGIFVSIIFSLFLIVDNITKKKSVFAETVTNNKLPNIILLGSDGLDATHLSLYGYERDTTPHMNKLGSIALVAENAFPNAGTTGGSIASIMTSKLPLETGVIYPPDILNGVNAYQHLPGILRRAGYRTVDLSVPYYGDAITLNLLDGYDIANLGLDTNNFLLRIIRFVSGGDGAYFADTILQRILDRLLHIFFLKPMINPYEIVIQPASRSNEQNRFNELISILDDSQLPVFIHVHMLGTHGPSFEIRDQIFSEGQKQEHSWMIDFYDDAILSFDQYVGELYDYLTKSEQLENTIIIVYSDHGMMWATNQRVPLIFWFPNGEFANRIKVNVQNIDIAPTILDYLDMPIPNWVDGQTLLEHDLKPPQYIFSASVEASLVDVTKEGLWAVEAERRSPPFYQVGYVGLIACGQWYELYVQDPSLLYGTVKGETGSCASVAEPDPENAKQILLEYLHENGYDILSFPAFVPIRYIE